MNIKVRAAGKTAGMLAFFSIVLALSFALASVLSLQTISYIFMVGFFGYLTWIIYGINLSQLQYKELEQKQKESK